MRTDNQHINQSSEITALRNELSDLKAMMSVMQEIIMNQNKQINDMHKALFNNPVKSKEVLKEEKINSIRARLMLKNIRK